MKYKYLFPFEKIESHARIVIYGAGELGRAYLEQVLITGYCDVVGFVDKNYKQYDDADFNVYSPDEIQNLSFDYIVIAVKGKALLPEIFRVLESMKVKKEKIIYVGLRNQELIQTDNTLEQIPSNKNKRIRIAIFLLSGIGGMIFIKRWIMEILKYLPDCDVDLYCGNHDCFARYLFSDVDNVKNIIPNLGNRYQRNKNQYTMSVRVAGGGWISIDVFKEWMIPSKYTEFVEKIEQLKERLAKEEFVLDVTPRIVTFEKSRFLGENAYTSLGFGIFDLHDIHVSIPLTEKAKYGFEKLRLEKYITVNTGNGSSKDASRIAKTWPLSHYEEMVSRFKKAYPDIEVVQLGDNNSEKIKAANRFIFGEEFDVVSYVLKYAIFHFDIEGGLVHIASQLGTKCVVLFGPTPEYYYGYKENINIKAGNCHECCGVYLNHNTCARNLEQPKCMYGIRPSLVMAHVDNYMRQIGLRD